jgi:hypothetical protein
MQPIPCLTKLLFIGLLGAAAVFAVVVPIRNLSQGTSGHEHQKTDLNLTPKTTRNSP